MNNSAPMDRLLLHLSTMLLLAGGLLIGILGTETVLVAQRSPLSAPLALVVKPATAKMTVPVPAAGEVHSNSTNDNYCP